MTPCANCGEHVLRNGRFRMKLREWGAILPHVDGPLCVTCFDAVKQALEERERDADPREVEV